MREEESKALYTINQVIISMIKKLSIEMKVDEETRKLLIDDIKILKNMSEHIERNIDRFSKEDALWIERTLGRLDAMLGLMAKGVIDVK